MLASDPRRSQEPDDAGEGREPTDRKAVLAALRARLSSMERRSLDGRGAASTSVSVVPVADPVDAHLPARGLVFGAVHEVLEGDLGAATGFLAVIAGRASGLRGNGPAPASTVMWIGPDSDVWPPGLVRMGLRPEALVLVRAKGDDALWAAEEALRCPAVACVVTEIGARRGGGIDLTESRRLALAAEAGGGIGLLLRPDAQDILPTAAVTRWRISAVPGTGRVDHELGDAGWRVELLKARGAATPATWDLAWSSERAELADLHDGARDMALPTRRAMG